MNINLPKRFHFPGDPPNHWPSDGAEDEQAALEPSEYVARGAAPEQVVASEYFKVSECHYRLLMDLH